jgi:WD40 repeat protein
LRQKHAPEKGLLTTNFNNALTHRLACGCCCQSPDGKYIACGAIDGIIYIFEVVSEKLIHTLEGKTIPIMKLSLLVMFFSL